MEEEKPEKGPYKCRGQYEDLSEERKAEVEELCRSVEFSSAFFLMPLDVLEKYWPNMKDKLPPNTTLEEAKNMFSSLGTTISIDRKRLHSLGMTHKQLGDALKTVMKLAVHKSDLHCPGSGMAQFMAMITGKIPDMPKFETPFQALIREDSQWCDQGRFESTFEFNGQKLRVFVIFWGGAQICPFQPKEDQHSHYKGYHYGARDVVVTNLTNNKTLTYSTLLPHMIKHHGFLEGPFCWYRVNPPNVLRVLGRFEDGKSYKLKSEKVVKMRSVGASGTTQHPKLEELKAANDVKIIQLRHHDVFWSSDGEVCFNPLDNTEIVTQEEHEQRLRDLEVEEDQVRANMFDTMKPKATKIYKWSDWLPEVEDGAHSKSAEEASGPRVMMLSGFKQKAQQEKQEEQEEQDDKEVEDDKN